MKTKIFLAMLLCPILALAGIRYSESELQVQNVQTVKNGQNLDISMDLDYTKFPIKSNQELRVTPILRNGANVQALQSVTFAGHNRYFYHKRNDDGTVNLMRNGKKAIFDYSASVPFQSWMNNCELVMSYQVNGCCGNTAATFETPVKDVRFAPPTLTPAFAYIEPVAEKVKIRNVKGTAYIDFIVNKTNIDPTYRRNKAELAKITTTINLVRDDKDVTLKSMAIKGYASPEGPYENNVRLAKGRTAALEEYVQNLYKFPDGFITTSFDAANFQGLKAYLDTNEVADKAGILDILASDLQPYDKNQKIRTTYPNEYAWLLKNVYPSLRKSDYEVEYTVRSYTDVAEIIEVMKKNPQKLSLHEFYLAAQSMQPGSDEFNHVFDVAAAMFPDDPTANLNAANSAMQRGDLVSAGRFLRKAGNSNEARYAQGLLAALNKDYDTAIATMKILQNAMPQAQQMLQQLQAIKAWQGK